MNANDATLTALTTTQTGNRAASNAPNAPAAASFDLVLTAVVGSTLGSWAVGGYLHGGRSHTLVLHCC